MGKVLPPLDVVIKIRQKTTFLIAGWPEANSLKNNRISIKILIFNYTSKEHYIPKQAISYRFFI
jgi:hypothetical protein